MKKKFMLLVLVFALVAAFSFARGGKEKSGDGDPILLGHLTHHTGPYGHVGPMFDGAADFSLEFVNANPPLGRKVVVIHQDVGTLGENSAARRLIESNRVDILLNSSHGYMSYRDWLRGYIQRVDGKGPLLPSVHGGGINSEYGGNKEEPLFRGSPMDSDQGIACALHAQQEGAKTVVIMAVDNDGGQMQKEAAAAACKALGMEVLLEIDFQAEQTSYRSIIARAQALNPDALIIFSAAEDGGVIVKNAAEMGMSNIIVGPTDWLFVEFPQTATMSAIKQHISVTAVGFSFADSPAWDFYKAAWEGSKYADLAEASNSYVMQYYDLLNVTMLAIEKAGSTDISPWVQAMFDVAMAPGTKVYTYEEGIKALRRGEAIDYEGVTGSFDYTETAVVGGLYGVFEWKDLNNLERVKTIEGLTILDLSAKIN